MALEGKLPKEHKIINDPNAPNISFISVNILSNNFWSHIARSSDS
jgi:hypothetical protein